MSREQRTLWSLSIFSLSQRPGQTMAVEETLPAPSGVGDQIVGVPEGADISLTGTLTSMSDGILFNGKVSAELTGECTRCLTAVHKEVAAPVTAFFTYDMPAQETTGEAELDSLEDEEDSQDLYPLSPSATMIDFESLVRDNLAEALPLQLLCKEDCLGLCPQCGINLNEHPDHEHQVTDLRWAGLEDFKQRLESQE